MRRQRHSAKQIASAAFSRLYHLPRSIPRTNKNRRRRREFDSPLLRRFQVVRHGVLVRCYLVHAHPEAGGGQGAQDEADVAGDVLGHFNSPICVCLLCFFCSCSFLNDACIIKHSRGRVGRVNPTVNPTIGMVGLGNQELIFTGGISTFNELIGCPIRAESIEQRHKQKAPGFPRELLSLQPPTRASERRRSAAPGTATATPSG